MTTLQSTNTKEPRLKELGQQIEALTEDYLSKAAQVRYLQIKLASKEKEMDAVGALLVNRFNEQVQLERGSPASSPRRPIPSPAATVASCSS